MAEKKCRICGVCYEDRTGICPAKQCAKGLLNGQCGGAKKGRCEVDGKRPCVWEIIESRLSPELRAAADTAIRDWREEL